MIVLKFGGTSVQDSASMNQAIDICLPYLSRSCLVVSSAMAGVTNEFVKLVECIKTKKSDTANSIVDHLEARHDATLREGSNEALYAEYKPKIDALFRDVRALVKGSVLLNECSLRVNDALLGTGELLATLLLVCLARKRGIETQWFDARTAIRTDDRFGEATVLWAPTQEAVRSLVYPKENVLWITQGFIGSTSSGVSTILGRGGSDYSASLFGAALDAEEIQIWTDVDGIMTTDPRKVAAARSIPQMSYAEAAELAFFGAKVVHPATIQPAVEKDIPVYVKNTKNSSHPGTRIGEKAAGVGLRAIAGRKGVTLLTVTSSRMLNAYGFLSRIFEIFQRFELSVDLVATSEVSVSMTVEESKDLTTVAQALESVGTVKIESDMAILCLVGQDIWKDTRFITRVFESIGSVSIKMISLGSSEINLSIVVKSDDLDRAVASIHKTFFEG